MSYGKANVLLREAGCSCPDTSQFLLHSELSLLHVERPVPAGGELPSLFATGLSWA